MEVRNMLTLTALLISAMAIIFGALALLFDIVAIVVSTITGKCPTSLLRMAYRCGLAGLSAAIAQHQTVYALILLVYVILAPNPAVSDAK
jgi:NADH:ubiquinone oxidoreductase subunit 3 (subunit A)